MSALSSCGPRKRAQLKCIGMKAQRISYNPDACLAVFLLAGEKVRSYWGVREKDVDKTVRSSACCADCKFGRLTSRPTPQRKPATFSPPPNKNPTFSLANRKQGIGNIHNL